MPDFVTDFIEIFNTDTLGTVKFILLAYVGLLWLSIMIWVTRDVLSRSNSILFQAFSILLTIAIPILGVVLYLIIRPQKTLSERYYESLEAKVLEEESEDTKSQKQSCDKCLIPVKDDYKYCPNCSCELKKNCTSCKKSFPNLWNVCPFCGTKYKEKEKSKNKESKKSDEKADKEDKKLTLSKAEK